MKNRLNWIHDREASNDPRSSDIVGWLTYDKKIEQFEKNTTHGLFHYLFDPIDDNGVLTPLTDIEKSESYRLWEHFCQGANSEFKKFLTYLSQEQKNDLMYNLDRNEDLLNYI